MPKQLTLLNGLRSGRPVPAATAPDRAKERADRQRRREAKHEKRRKEGKPAPQVRVKPEPEPVQVDPVRAPAPWMTATEILSEDES